MSLDRLIDLAKRTGDRLIIHDRYDDKDMVIMSVDAYEQLIVGRADIREMSESQMLNQIDRDISIWRANREMDEFEFGDDEPNTWASARGVLDEQYGNMAGSGVSTNFSALGGSALGGTLRNEEDDCEDDECFDCLDEDKIPASVTSGEDWEEPLVTPINPSQPISQIQVPQPNMLGESEPLSSDEPVFYEEPV